MIDEREGKVLNGGDEAEIVTLRSEIASLINIVDQLDRFLNLCVNYRTGVIIDETMDYRKDFYLVSKINICVN